VIPNSMVPFVPSACLLIRRNCFGDGFDETLRYGEDVDLVWRLHDRGWLVRYVADVAVTHRAETPARVVGPTHPLWTVIERTRPTSRDAARALSRRHVDALYVVSVLVGKPMVGLRIIDAARDQLRERLLPTTDNADKVTTELVGRGMVRAGPLMARAAVRTFGVVIVLCALHPKLRRRALTLFIVGTAYRWRSTRVRVADIPLGVADDVATGWAS